MRYFRLGTFLITSSALHIVALFILAVFFHTVDVVTKPQSISVGVLSEYKNSGVGKGDSLEPSTKEAPNREKKVVKRIARKNQKRETKKKETITQANESVTQQSTVESDRNSEGEQTSESILILYPLYPTYSMFL